MPNSDWLPGAEGPLLDLIDIWDNEGLANPVYKTQFNWPDADCTATLAKMTAFKNARASFEADNSTTRRIAKDAAKKRPPSPCGILPTSTSVTTRKSPRK